MKNDMIDVLSGISALARRNCGNVFPEQTEIKIIGDLSEAYRK